MGLTTVNEVLSKVFQGMNLESRLGVLRLVPINGRAYGTPRLVGMSPVEHRFEIIPLMEKRETHKDGLMKGCTTVLYHGSPQGKWHIWGFHVVLISATCGTICEQRFNFEDYGSSTFATLRLDEQGEWEPVNTSGSRPGTGWDDAIIEDIKKFINIF